VTDASKIACAGILLQNINNQQKIIAVVSKTLTVTEQNWSATEREAYAIARYLVKYRKTRLFFERESFCTAYAVAKISKINNDNTFSISPLCRTRAATKKLQDEAAAEKEDADYR
jgi:hypothetical protein